MAKVGKWGITRDDDGTLSDIWAWPWPWRYATSALIVAGVAFYLAFLDDGRTQWIPAAVAITGALFALSIAYEIGCLAMLLGIGAAIWAALGAIFPESSKNQSIVIVVIVVAAAVYGYTGIQARIKLRNKELEDRLIKTQDELRTLQGLLYDMIKESRKLPISNIAEEIRQLRWSIRDSNDDNERRHLAITAQIEKLNDFGDIDPDS